MLSKIVKKKEYAFKKGTYYMDNLKQDCFNYAKDTIYNDLSSKGFSNLSNEVMSEIMNKYIGLNVDEITKYIYNNNNFDEYLKYSFLGKYYERRITLIQWIIIILFILMGVGIYFIFGLGIVFGILVFLLIIGLLLIFKFLLKSGESYKSYYNRTMLSLLLSIYGNINFNIDGYNSLTDDELKLVMNDIYDKKNIKNNINFSGFNCNGNILDLELIRTIESRDKNGNVTKRDDKIFDGFYLKININNVQNVLRGNSIRIRADENVFSSITEDTVRGIYESQREISFNSEEMNKSFDARISGYNGFETIDDMMIQVQKIITPSFEEHLLYLRERYNSFDMNITDSGIVASFNMDRSLFQKIKHKEVLDFKNTYREANEKFRMLNPDLTGISDFAYYNVFPFLERLYLVNYLTYLYLSYMYFDNYFSLNNESINNFEKVMRNIYTLDNKDFKEIYTDKLKTIRDNTKELANSFKIEEM